MDQCGYNDTTTTTITLDLSFKAKNAEIKKETEIYSSFNF
jgi:hypothetical protein